MERFVDIHSNRKAAAVFVSGLLLAGISAYSPVFAGDADKGARADTIAACTEAARLLEADDVDGALEEAQWCKEGLLQIKQNQTLAVFPDSVNGYEGGEVTNSGALGMVMLGREYENDGKRISIELTTGSVPGLGSLGQLMSAFGSVGLGEGKKFRIQRRTVVDTSTGGSAHLTVQLKSGGLMTVESSSVSGEDVIEFLKAFPIAEIDDAIGK